MTREQNIRAILECNFAGFKDELIDKAVESIVDLSDIDEAYRAGYTGGAEDAWQTAQSILSLSENDSLQWFGASGKAVFSSFDAEDAMNRWNDYVAHLFNSEDDDEDVVWHDIPTEEMNEKQLRKAVRELREYSSKLRYELLKCGVRA